MTDEVPEFFKVFDCHHHVGVFDGTSGPSLPPSLASEQAARLEIMDRGGVHQVAVIPGHSYPRPDGILSTRKVNDQISSYREAAPDRFAVAIGIIEPSFGVASAVEEVQRCRDELGLSGISFHARFQGINMDAPSVEACVGAIAEVGMVPMLHALAEVPDESVWKAARLAERFPETPMIALDAFSSFDSISLASYVATHAPNLIFDTSLAISFDFVEDFALEHGAHRVMFGTDLYSPPVGKHISPLLSHLQASTRLSRVDISLIVGGNARRVFGIGSDEPL